MYLCPYNINILTKTKNCLFTDTKILGLFIRDCVKGIVTIFSQIGITL